MSYDTSGRSKPKAAETQSLLPDTLRQENVKIEGQLTKFQNNLRLFIKMVSLAQIVSDLLLRYRKKT